MDISVVIPTYNRYKLLKRSLLSVLNQTHKPKEILVIDDGSADFTCKIKNEFTQIKYIYKKNGGVSSARNLGIKNSTCKWVAFLDDDDEWDKEKLALHVSFHRQNPSLHVSYANEKWIRNGIEVKVPKKYSKHSGNIFEKCLSHCIIAPSSVLMRKDLFDKVGYFDEDLEVCEDYDLWLRISSLYPIGLIDKPLIIKHSGESEQLGFKHWGMDRFRVKSLHKIYPSLKDEKQKKALRDMILDKLKFLIIGAKKHKRSKMTKEFENMAISYM